MFDCMLRSPPIHTAFTLPLFTRDAFPSACFHFNRESACPRSFNPFEVVRDKLVSSRAPLPSPLGKACGDILIILLGEASPCSHSRGFYSGQEISKRASVFLPAVIPQDHVEHPLLACLDF